MAGKKKITKNKKSEAISDGQILSKKRKYTKKAKVKPITEDEPLVVTTESPFQNKKDDIFQNWNKEDDESYREKIRKMDNLQEEDIRKAIVIIDKAIKRNCYYGGLFIFMLLLAYIGSRKKPEQAFSFGMSAGVSCGGLMMAIIYIVQWYGMKLELLEKLENK